MNATPDNTSADPERRIADLERQLAEREAELAEAREQQTATAEVLQVINSSPGDLTPVFDSILEKAHSLCGAPLGTLVLRDGDQLRAVAMRGHPQEYETLARQGFPPTPAFKLFLNGESFLHVPDGSKPPTGLEDHPMRRAAAEISGVRTVLFVPLRKDETVLGYISAQRQEVRPFSDKQIALLQNFAAQAVIAMENARLLTETREALDQQTATAEVLAVINSSPGDLAPVFDAITEKAMRLCGAAMGGIYSYDGEWFKPAALRGVTPEFATFSATVPKGLLAPTLILETKRPVQFPDLADTSSYGGRIIDSSVAGSMIDLGSIRAVLDVPLLKEGALFGFIAIYREEAGPFSDKQVALLESFAAQAVIAMENARLLTETREALEQQTATAEVLQVINSSPGNLTPVFEAMLDKALARCDAAFGIMLTFDGRQFHHGAVRGVPEAFAKYRRQNPPTFGPETSPGRHRSGENIVHFPDIMTLGSYKNREPGSEVVDLGGARTLLSVALRNNTDLLGTLAIYRQEVRPFSDKEIALLENFAAQAVIAMENARLLTETREALEQQTATAEVLGVINSSPGDLTPVFDAMLDKALRLCEASLGNVLTYDGQRLSVAANRGHPQFDEWLRGLGAFVPEVGSTNERIVHGESIIEVRDLVDDPASTPENPIRRGLIEIGGFRTCLSVALRKESSLLGVLHIFREEVRPFSEKEIALLQNFAAQAVIAMENARLIRELRQRTDEVAELNRGLKARVAEQVEELGRVGRLKRFLAPQLAELIVSQGNEKILESHRREIVVVFCDLRGYTAFAETAEPEEVLDFLREYHGALGPLVAQFEGTLDQFSGDGIMVFFNDPVPIPAPAERAVNMAVAMREAAGNLIADWRERGRELGFGAGIAQGYATLGQIGFSERSGYTAIGTVCNVAARLCSEAKDGQILLSQRVNAALRGSVATEQVGALTLKGLTQPTVAYNVPSVGSQAGFRVIEGGAPSV
jgi:adenylate cyclase